jgi:hypothetical protein
VESERLVQRVIGYLVVGVVALGVLGTLFVNAVANTSRFDTVTLFLPAVIFTATGLITAWAIMSLSLFIRSRFIKHE